MLLFIMCKIISRFYKQSPYMCLNCTKHIFCKYQNNSFKRGVLFFPVVSDKKLGFTVRLLCCKGIEWNNTPQNQALYELTHSWTRCNCSLSPVVTDFHLSHKSLTYAYNQPLHIRGLCRWSLPRK